MIFYQLIARTIVLSTCLFSVSAAQTPAAESTGNHQDSILGKWQCVAKTNALGELKPIMDIALEGTKLRVVVRTAQGAVATNNVTFVDGKLSAILSSGDGTSGRVIGRLKEGKLVGEFSYGPEVTGTFSCAKEGSVATEKSGDNASLTKSPAGDQISGDWSGGMNPSNAGEISIHLQLKQEGGGVSGTISLPQGSVPIKRGSWTNNQLTFTAETQNGKVSFRAVLQGEALTGSYEVAGQGGKWSVTRKTSTPK